MKALAFGGAWGLKFVVVSQVSYIGEKLFSKWKKIVCKSSCMSACIRIKLFLEIDTIHFKKNVKDLNSFDKTIKS